MITYKYYNFPTKDLVPKPNEWPEGVYYYELGTIFNKDGEYDVNGLVLQSPTAKPGWHVNVCYQKPINLDFIQQYEIDVTSPECIWSGQKA